MGTGPGPGVAAFAASTRAGSGVTVPGCGKLSMIVCWSRINVVSRPCTADNLQP